MTDPVETTEEEAPEVEAAPVVDEAVAAPVQEPAPVTERVRRFRNDTDASIAWNGHAIPPHQDVEFLSPVGELVLAPGISETTDQARFVTQVVATPVEDTVAIAPPEWATAHGQAVAEDPPTPPPVDA